MYFSIYKLYLNKADFKIHMYVNTHVYTHIYVYVCVILFRFRIWKYIERWLLTPEKCVYVKFYV